MARSGADPQAGGRKALRRLSNWCLQGAYRVPIRWRNKGTYGQLDTEKSLWNHLAPRVGIEPTTNGLTVRSRGAGELALRLVLEPLGTDNYLRLRAQNPTCTKWESG